MPLFQSSMGGQGIVNTFQFPTQAQLPDPSLMFNALQATQRGSGRTSGSRTDDSGKERNWTPGQQRRYDMTKATLDAEKQSMYNHWLKVAEDEYGGRFAEMLKEKQGEINKQISALAIAERSLDEGNFQRTENAKRLEELRSDPKFMNNYVIDDQGLAYGFKGVYNEEGDFVAETHGWGGIGDSDFMPMKGSQAYHFLSQDDRFLDTMSLPNVYDPSKWKDDIKSYLDSAVGNRFTSRSAGSNTIDSDNRRHINQALKNVGLLIDSEIRPGLFNEAMRYSEIERRHWEVGTDGYLRSTVIAGEDGSTKINTRNNPHEAAEQILRDRAAAEAMTRFNISSVSVPETGRSTRTGNEYRAPWTQMIGGGTMPDQTMIFTFNSPGASQEKIEKDFNTILTSEAQAKRIAKYREEFLEEKGIPSGLGVEFATEFGEWYANKIKDETGDELTGEQALRFYEDYQGAVSNLNQPIWKKLLFSNHGVTYLSLKGAQAFSNVFRGDEKISTSLFQPSHMRHLLSGETRTLLSNKEDIQLAIYNGDQEMMDAAIKAFGNTLPNSEEVLFPGLSHSNWRAIVGDGPPPLVEFTGSIIGHAPTSTGETGTYVGAVAYLTKERLERFTLRVLKGSGRDVREVDIPATDRIEFQTVNAASVGARYGENRKFLQEAVQTEMANGEELFAVPVFLLLGHNDFKTFDDYIKRKDEARGLNAKIIEDDIRKQEELMALINLTEAVENVGEKKGKD